MATTSHLPPLSEADSLAPGRYGMYRDSAGRTVIAHRPGAGGHVNVVVTSDHDGDAPTSGPAAAPWRSRMVPGTTPTLPRATDAPVAGQPNDRPAMSADRAALYALHAPASIASRRAAA